MTDGTEVGDCCLTLAAPDRREFRHTNNKVGETSDVKAHADSISAGLFNTGLNLGTFEQGGTQDWVEFIKASNLVGVSLRGRHPNYGQGFYRATRVGLSQSADYERFYSARTSVPAHGYQGLL